MRRQKKCAVKAKAGRATFVFREGAGGAFTVKSTRGTPVASGVVLAHGARMKERAADSIRWLGLEPAFRRFKKCVQRRRRG